MFIRNKKHVFDRILESVVYIETKTQNKCNLILFGDFNCRTSINPDFVSEDDSIHMNVLPDEYIPDRFMDRYSQDIGHINNNGLLLLDLCKQTGIRILNGRVGADSGVGKFTFIGSRGSSLVDYVLASQNLFQCVSKFEVDDPKIISDHCSISFTLEVGIEELQDSLEENCEYVDGKFV